MQTFSIGGDSTKLACTATSGSAPIGGTRIVVTNTGSDTAWIKFGTSTVTATVATGFPILSGHVQSFTKTLEQTHVAGICDTGKTTDLYITTGSGI